MCPEHFIEDQVELTKTAPRVFPEKKIIVSEITPRTDGLDEIVIAFNNGVHEQIKGLSTIHHVANGNLREYRFFHHTKHLSKRSGIPILEKNLKNALPLAVRPKRQQKNPYPPKPKQELKKRNQAHITTLTSPTSVQRPPCPLPQWDHHQNNHPIHNIHQ